MFWEVPQTMALALFLPWMTILSALMVTSPPPHWIAALPLPFAVRFTLSQLPPVGFVMVTPGLLPPLCRAEPLVPETATRLAWMVSVPVSMPQGPSKLAVPPAVTATGLPLAETA